MRTRLIVLIDFSPYSQTLLKLAGKWSKMIQADLLLVHQVPGLIPAFTDSESRQQINAIEKEEALTNLTKLAQEAISTPANITYLVSEKSLLLSLSELHTPDSNDLVLVGLKGTGLLKQIFIGSTAIQLIEELNCPIITVPQQTSTLVPKKLIVALSYRYPLNVIAFNSFLSTFKDSITQVEFISVVASKDIEEESITYLTRLRNNYEGHIPSSFQIFKGENTFDEIKNYVKQNNDAMLVVQKGSRSLTDKLFRKFLINELVFDGATPLTVIPS
ncbi:universal stress protein [Pontibacter qinzhouensis]|uniref:Universal stress protein n=1 Tax=Pontibacter qinzhouensis TaxID=2603253 RepID=A0A5C8KB93_9BACT|nr:universal stress protein [Pontibacter qinzhouensis]TXK47150.1 universal stress protein [Pontibacter qinzhouensis]